MAKFHYIASDPSGKVLEGEMEANSPAAILGWMSQQGLRPVSIKSKDKRSIFSKQFGESITIEDKVFITRYLVMKTLSSIVIDSPNCLEKILLLSLDLMDTGRKPCWDIQPKIAAGEFASISPSRTLPLGSDAI